MSYDHPSHHRNIHDVVVESHWVRTDVRVVSDKVETLHTHRYKCFRLWIANTDG